MFQGADPRRDPAERGAVLVESTILFPLIILLVFGIIEFGFLFKAQHTVDNASARAGRQVASLPKSDEFANRAADVVARNMSVLNQGEPYRLMIYRVVVGDGEGKLPNGATVDEPQAIWDACAAGAAEPHLRANCVRFEWDGDSWEDQTAGDAGWEAEDMWACAPEQEADVGTEGERDTFAVYVWARWRPLTPLFEPFLGEQRDVVGRGVFDLDPYQGAESCKGAENLP